MGSDVDVELRVEIAAPPGTVFDFFRDPRRFSQWMGADSEIDLRPGGALTVRYPGDAPPARGEVVEAIEGERIVFTWGYEGGANGLPEGSSRVSVDLRRIPQGTELTLRHSGLPTGELRLGHLGGWRHYFGVMAWRAARAALEPILETSVDTLIAAWNEPDSEARRTLLDACWAEDALFADRMGYVEGIDAMDAFIGNAHRFMPSFRVERIGPIDEMHGRVRFRWSMSGPGGEIGAGWNFGRIAPDGRLLELTGFWGDAQAPS